MNVMLVLPELEEGGVERHVLSLAGGLSSLGHCVIVVSFGGKLVSRLPECVRHVAMPVHKKNLFTGLACAMRLAKLVKRHSVDVVHAHSRVPAWICCFVKQFSGVKFVCTAHARYSLNYGLRPFRAADGVICVSEAVREYMSDWLPQGAVRVIYNSLPGEVVPWAGSGDGVKRLLYIGRLTPKKGAMILIEALAKLGVGGWTLDVVGSGPMESEMKSRAVELGLGDRVIFHGYRDDAARWLSRCDLFLFPSLDEGMGLAFAEALSAGAPVIASDLSSVRELVTSGGVGRDSLAPPGDVVAWRNAIARFLDVGYVAPLSLAVKLPTASEMAAETVSFYDDISGVR
jgi:glycosyltransferase involved in cell wall biosynthesis